MSAWPKEDSVLDVVAVRRDLHAHPELAFAEKRTTALIVEHLASLGLAPEVLPVGTGVVCDIGTAGPLNKPTETGNVSPTCGIPISRPPRPDLRSAAHLR